jgi:hypothetical protein
VRAEFMAARMVLRAPTSTFLVRKGAVIPEPMLKVAVRELKNFIFSEVEFVTRAQSVNSL